MCFGVSISDCWVYFVVYMCLCCSERFESLGILLLSTYGFENTDPQAADKMLSFKGEAKVLNVDFKLFDSRNKNNILNNANFYPTNNQG